MTFLGAELPDTFLGWIELIGLAVVALTALYYVFRKEQSSHKEDADKTDDRLINLLKDEVAVLTRTSEQQGKDIEAMKTLLIEMRKENEVFRLVFQNRDPDSIAIREESRAAMKVVYEIQKDMARLYGAINKHLERLEKAETGVKKETIVKTVESL